MEYPEQKANPSEIDAALKALEAPSIYCVASKDPSAIELSPQELSYLESIGSSKRAKHFAMGRNAARLALRKIQKEQERLEDWPLYRLDSGLVNWPSGIVGSISHCQDIAVAAVAEKNKFKSIGLDLEFYREVNEATIARIANSSELEMIANSIAELHTNFFAIFSAKESIFKAIFPTINHKFGFGAVRLKAVKSVLLPNVNTEISELEFRIVENLSSQFSIGIPIVVRLYQTDSFALTLCALPVIL